RKTTPSGSTRSPPRVFVRRRARETTMRVAVVREVAWRCSRPSTLPDYLRYRDVFEETQLVEHLARAHDDGGQGVFADHDRQTRLLAQQDVEVAQEGAASRQHDALVDDVGRELRRTALETDPHRL